MRGVSIWGHGKTDDSWDYECIPVKTKLEVMLGIGFLIVESINLDIPSHTDHGRHQR
jgi:hypothetical protein